MKHVIQEIVNNKLNPQIYVQGFNPEVLTWVDIEIFLNDYYHPVDIECIDTTGRTFKLIRDRNSSHNNASSVLDFKKLIVDQKCSFVMSGMSRINKSFNNLSTMLEETFKGNSDVHIFGGLYTESRSFDIHKDKAHNTILQLDGVSRWQVWDIASNYIKDDPIIDQELNPGDIIFIPLNWYHRCIPKGKRLSASFPVWPNVKRLERSWIDLSNS